MRALCALYLFVTINFNIDFRFELSHIDKICEGKVHVLEEFVELAYQMQILCQFLVKTFIPVWRWAIHANERIEGFIFISWKRKSQDRCAISINWIQILIT